MKDMVDLIRMTEDRVGYAAIALKEGYVNLRDDVRKGSSDSLANEMYLVGRPRTNLWYNDLD